MSSDKVYYNVTIKYDRTNNVPKSTTAYARTKVQMAESLIDNTGDYDLCVSKFRVDSCTIPFVIPEIKQPQDVENKIVLNYWVELMTCNDDLTMYNRTRKEYLSLIGKSFSPMCAVTKPLDHFTNYKSDETPVNGKTISTVCRCTDRETYDCIDIDVTKSWKKEDGTYDSVINNLDRECYIYDPQEFVDSMNVALANLFEDTKVEEQVTENGKQVDTTYSKDDKTTHAFFVLDGSRLKFYQKPDSKYIILFSPNLYKYFGLGFNVKWMNKLTIDPEREGWMIANNAMTRTDAKDYRDEYLMRYGNPNYHGVDKTNGGTFENALPDDIKRFNIATNQFDITQTWTACKSILICSDTLPIRGEYIPTSPNDGLLIHENSDSCLSTFSNLASLDGMNIESSSSSSSSSLSDPASSLSIYAPPTRVLEAFYPVCAQGGDIRTTIIFSNETMDTSTKHALTGDAVNLANFDICVKWLDIYNNIHDLELMEGCSCDIRLAFVKKSVKQDVLYRGIQEIVAALGGRDPMLPREKRMKNGFQYI